MMSRLAMRPSQHLGRDTRLFLRSALDYAPSRLVPALVGLISVSTLGRLLSPANFGSLTLVIAGVPYVALIVGDWLIGGYQREAHLPRENSREVQAATWLLFLGGSSAVALTVGGLLSGVPEVVAIGLLLLPYLLMRLQWTKLQMTGKSRVYTLLQILQTSSRAAGMVVAAWLTHKFGPVILGWLVASIGLVVLGPRLRFRVRPDRAALAALARVGLPLIAASLSLNVMATADRFVIAAAMGRDAAGVYGYGYLVGENLLSLPASALYLSAFWLATTMWDRHRQEDAQAFISRLLRAQLAVGLGLALGLTLISEPLLRALAGNAYLMATPIVGLVAVAQLPAAGVPYLVLLTVLRRETKRTIAPSVAAAFVNVPVTIFAVNVDGITGAAVATIATYVLYAAFLAKATKPNVFTVRLQIAVFLSVSAATGFALEHSTTPRTFLGVVSVGSLLIGLLPSRRILPSGLCR